ncbi:hypothetical protein SSABA_v1c08780 [Spiroplasma sabaudiense Ar-1343]|uniref:Lipoprotein n=1 Tax=Spiroplasma sabaudiense Ar-1343 TaxID=1276257 RepID=W6AB56_9MOLU|nr:lipoprotein [Spiroplasma sabaudiense]AHI54277.1 hypothetical protein SSABA_v1c08780 [Spiroplasma sabaudiense Ar-1343]
MKKLLSVLGALSLATIPASGVVACNVGITPPEINEELKYGDLSEILEVRDLGRIEVEPTEDKIGIISLDVFKDLIDKNNKNDLDWDKLDVVININEAIVSPKAEEIEPEKVPEIEMFDEEIEEQIEEKYTGEAVTVTFKAFADLNKSLTSKVLGEVNSEAEDDVFLNEILLELGKLTRNTKFNPSSNDGYSLKDKTSSTVILVGGEEAEYFGEATISFTSMSS